MKIINFYCDIMGTYTSDDSNRDLELKKFANNLEKLIDLEQADEINFYFASDLDKYKINYCYQELSRYIQNNSIKLIELERDNSINFYDKIMLIMNNFISCIKNNINDEVILYFADDSDINHFLLFRQLSKKLPGVKHNHFILCQKPLMIDDFKNEMIDGDSNYILSSNKDLSALNESIENYVINKKKEQREITTMYKKTIN